MVIILLCLSTNEGQIQTKYTVTLIAPFYSNYPRASITDMTRELVGSAGPKVSCRLH